MKRMTLEERIEAAAKAAYANTYGESHSWIADPSVHDNYRAEARAILLAAFPELFSDPPLAWIAPMELPQAAYDAWVATAAGPIECESYEAAALDWAYARDAFLKGGDA